MVAEIDRHNSDAWHSPEMTPDGRHLVTGNGTVYVLQLKAWREQ